MSKQPTESSLEVSATEEMQVSGGDSDIDRFADSLKQAECSLWRHHRVLWWITFLGPVLVTAAIVVVVYVFAGADFAGRLVTTAVTGMLLFGRFIILAGHDPEVARVTGSFSSGQLFLMVTYLDLVVATMLIFHAGFLFRLPWFGSRAAALVDDGRFLIHAQPWIRRATLFGLVLFVAIPLAAMGSVGGTIFGRMLGVSRLRIFIAILLGSLLGNGAMWYGSELINHVVDKHHPVVRFGGLVLILLLIVLIEFLYRRTRRTELQSMQGSQ